MPWLGCAILSDVDVYIVYQYRDAVGGNATCGVLGIDIGLAIPSGRRDTMRYAGIQEVLSSINMQSAGRLCASR